MRENIVVMATIISQDAGGICVIIPRNKLPNLILFQILYRNLAKTVKNINAITCIKCERIIRHFIRYEYDRLGRFRGLVSIAKEFPL